jgi:hypothetical protein
MLGVVYHFDGATWTTTVPDPQSFNRDLWSVWGSSPGDVYAAGIQGLVMRWNGRRWVEQPTPTGEVLFDLWGSGAGDVVAVGSHSVVLRLDGGAWRAEAVPPVPAGAGRHVGPSFHAVWGSARDDVYAVGDGGHIVRYDGAAWHVEPSGTSQVLNDVSGCGAGDIFAVGENGTVLRRAAGRWAPQASGSRASLSGVWCVSPHEVYAVGTGGTILRYDGASWARLDSHVAADLYGIWGDRSGRLFVAGDGAILASAAGRCVPGAMNPGCGLRVDDPNPPLNVRAGPSTDAAVVGTLDNGAPLVVGGQSGRWLHLAGPVEGWVWADSTYEHCEPPSGPAEGGQATPTY